MVCDVEIQVHRYHDGELSPPERAAVEAHLRECVQCRRLLADLQGLSSLLAGAPLADMPAEAVGRLQATWYTANNRGVLRVASWLTGAAAAVLIGALLAWPTDHANGEAQPALWQTVAVMPPEQVNDPGADLVVMAEWMADELSTGEKR